MKCCICLSIIKKDCSVFQCNNCNNFTHYKCYTKWIKKKSISICPYCNFKSDNKIDESIYVDIPSESSNSTSSTASSSPDDTDYEEHIDYENGIESASLQNRRTYYKLFCTVLGTIFILYFLINIRYFPYNRYNITAV